MNVKMVIIFKKNSASYVYNNRSAKKGAQLVPMRIPKYYWKTWFPKSKNYTDVVYQKLEHLIISTSEYMRAQIEWFLDEIKRAFRTNDIEGSSEF